MGDRGCGVRGETDLENDLDRVEDLEGFKKNRYLSRTIHHQQEDWPAHKKLISICYMEIEAPNYALQSPKRNCLQWKQNYERNKQQQLRASSSLSSSLTQASLPGGKTSINPTDVLEKHTYCVCTASYKPIRAYRTNTRPKVERFYLPETFSKNGGKAAKTNLCFYLI